MQTACRGVIEGMEGFSDTAGHAAAHRRCGRADPPQVQGEARRQGDTRRREGAPAPRAVRDVRAGAHPRRQRRSSSRRLPRPQAARERNVLGTPIFGEGISTARAVRRSELKQTPAWAFAGGDRNSGGRKTRRANTTGPATTSLTAAEKAGCKIMVTLGGTPEWTRPFKVPTPAAGWTKPPAGTGAPATGYSTRSHGTLRKVDYRVLPALLEGRQGRLWGVENYNEPWEGGGISGWARDMLQYRALQKLIATLPAASRPTSRCSPPARS